MRAEKLRQTKLRYTWKFFSFHPFFPKNRTTISESTSAALLSAHVVISSKAANRVFQLESARSVANLAGIISAASDSASSGVCLNLTVSSAPGASGAAALLDLLEAGGGTTFFTGGADAAGGVGPVLGASSVEAAGFLAYK